ncbi:MAG: hypothetical protein HY866_08865, partial [Chloroflexi bacterium]|nr:hypothetical protein [Chloroflexota bacterium]
MNLSWRTLTRQSAVLLFFALLGVITLSPLIFHLGTQVPGEIDFFHFNWNYWWMRHALETGQNPYYTEMVMVPFRHNLALHSLTPVWFPLYLIVEPIAGQLVATNLTLWISVVLTGWTTTLFLRQQKIHHALALSGGVILALSPNMRGQLLGTHLDLIGFFWMPVLLLLWDRVARQVTQAGGIGWAALVGLALWGAWLTDPVVMVWLALLLGPFALLTFFQAEGWRTRARLVFLGVFAVGIMLALAWIIGPLQPLLDSDMDAFSPLSYQTARDYALSLKVWEWQPQQGEPRGFGMLLVVVTGIALVMLVGRLFSLPLDRKTRAQQAAPLHNTLPPFSAQRGKGQGDRGKQSFPLNGRFWLLVALPPLILALGPDITVNGTQIPLPFRLLHNLTSGQYRVAGRFVPVATLALIVFAGQTFTPWITRLRRPAGRGLLVGALLLVYLADTHTFVPLDVMSPPPPYQFYTAMRHENADYVVLEVPTSP